MKKLHAYGGSFGVITIDNIWLHEVVDAWYDEGPDLGYPFHSIHTELEFRYNGGVL